jgi:hypothetical protein
VIPGIRAPKGIHFKPNFQSTGLNLSDQESREGAGARSIYQPVYLQPNQVDQGLMRHLVSLPVSNARWIYRCPIRPDVNVRRFQASDTQRRADLRAMIDAVLDCLHHEQVFTVRYLRNLLIGGNRHIYLCDPTKQQLPVTCLILATPPQIRER